MSDGNGKRRLGISEAWLTWMRDYSLAAHRFSLEESVDESPERGELNSIRVALFARGLALFDGAILLAENDRQLDFRIHARCVIEATMYLIALDRDPSFVSKMKDDDDKSRQDRAKLYRDSASIASTPDLKKELEDFLAQSGRGKRIELSTLLKGTDFDRLYRTYRDISAGHPH